MQAAELANYIVVSFRPESQGYRIEYIDILVAGVRPIREYCRDDVDFELLSNQWVNRGRTFSEYYDGFDEMLKQETKRLAKVRKVFE